MYTKDYPENVRLFLDDTKVLAKKYDINILLGKGSYLRLGSKNQVGGYFDEYDKTLAVASKHPLKKWLEVFVHESCHMDQWIEGSRYWKPELDDAIHMFDRYISGEKIQDIEAATDLIVMLEADCERRAVKKITQYELPINIENYAKKANAYLLSHKSMVYYQSWYKIPPYRHNCIWGKLSNKVAAPYMYKLQYNKINPEFFKSCFTK